MVPGCCTHVSLSANTDIIDNTDNTYLTCLTYLIYLAHLFCLTYLTYLAYNTYNINNVYNVDKFDNIAIRCNGSLIVELLAISTFRVGDCPAIARNGLRSACPERIQG